MFDVSPVLVTTLVLLPGMDGTGHLFAPLLAALDPDIKTRVVSYPVDEPLGYEALASIARAALPVDEPFILVGESFSGPIAVMLAGEGHAQLKGLVLCCSFVRNPRPLLAGLRVLLRLLPFAAAPMGVLNRLLLGHFSTPALRAALADAVGQVAPKVMRERLRAVVEVDVSARLTDLRVPCLYLKAAQDDVVPASAARLLTTLRPDTRVVRIEAPHCLLQAVPAEAAAVLGTFAWDVQ
jgi:pimeloyl-ACP methyl ester carboxylesterase